MNFEVSVEEAIILVDPVSTGRLLKTYVRESGRHVIGIFTLTQEELTAAGKHQSYEDKIASCTEHLHTKDLEECLAFVSSLPYTMVAVIPGSEPGVELADQLAAALKLRGNAAETSHLRRDKGAMRQAVKGAGLASPSFASCASRKEARAFAETHSFPLVVKTARGAGAHHVFTCESVEQVLQAFDVITNEQNIFGEKASTVLLEEYLRGPQYVVELLADGHAMHLVCVWRFLLEPSSGGPDRFRQADLITDAAELEALRDVTSYAEKVAKAVGIDWGPCLVELREDPERGPRLIEVGARISGIDLPLLSKAATSLDLFAATIDVYAGRETFVMPPVQFTGHASLLFCSARGAGRVAKLRGLEAIGALPSTISTKLHVSHGDVIKEARDLATIPLYVYLASSDKEQLRKDVDATRRSFGIDFEEGAKQ